MKLKFRWEASLEFALALAVAGGTVPAARAGTVQAPYEVGTWEGFRPAAVCFTFDDSCSNQFTIALPMFNQAGFRMTFFSVTSGPLFAGWSKLQNAASCGHEIASHTVTHADLSSLTDAQQLPELTNSQNAINANITNQSCLTLAYPNCNRGNDTLTATYYMAARTCTSTVNSKNPFAYTQLGAYICGLMGLKTLQSFQNTANSALPTGGWVVFLIHAIDDDVGYSPLPSSILQSAVTWFQANTNTFWVDSFGNIIRYIKERKDVSLAETSSNGFTLTAQVTGTLDNTIYNRPLTFRRPLPAGWGSASVIQNGIPVVSQIVMTNSLIFVLFDAVPNGGQVVITGTPPPPQLGLQIPATATKGDGLLAAQGTATVDSAQTNDIQVNLTSSNPSKVSVTPGVTIPAGQTNAAFDLTIGTDTLLDANQTVSVTAAASGYWSGQASIVIHDTNTSTLFVTLPARVSKGAGTLSAAGLVSLGQTVGANYTVQLTSGNTSKLVVPATAIFFTGSTSAAFNLTIVPNTIIDATQWVSVTAHVTNWVDGSASLGIVDNNPPPDHFTWGPVPSPQWVGLPFTATVTAEDAGNNTLLYNVPASFASLAPSANLTPTNMILGSPSAEQSINDGTEYVLGFSFIPSRNLAVTHVRSYFGDKVEIYTSYGSLIASQNVASIPGTWVETALPAPVILLAGSTYIVVAHENAQTYFWSTDLPATFPDGTITQSAWGYGDAFPDGGDDVRWYFVDLRYATNVVSIPVTPNQTGNFTNGIWSGSMTVLQPAANLVLEATVGPGSSGASAPLTVLATPQLGIGNAGNSVVISWPVAAGGFILEQSGNLSSPSGWTPVGIPPALNGAGDRYVITNSITSTNTFYRLKSP